MSQCTLVNHPLMECCCPAHPIYNWTLVAQATPNRPNWLSQLSSAEICRMNKPNTPSHEQTMCHCTLFQIGVYHGISHGISWYIPNFINLYWGWYIMALGLLIGLHKPQKTTLFSEGHMPSQSDVLLFSSSFTPVTQFCHRISWAQKKIQHDQVSKFKVPQNRHFWWSIETTWNHNATSNF